MSKLKMKTTATLMAILFLASIVAIPVQANGGNLVINGDFEDPVVTHPAEWDIFASVPGWTVEWYSVSTSYEDETRPDPALLELHRGVNDWLPYSGEQHAELDTDWDGPPSSEELKGEPASVKIYQDLETLPGKPYTLSYAWSPRPYYDDNELEVWWDGVKIGDHSGSGGSSTAWTLETKPVYASTGSTTRLEFVEVGNPDGLGMLLDAVSVARARARKDCPAEKATGEIEYYYPNGGPTEQVFREFNAHEEKGDRPAKGWSRWWRTTDGVMDRELYVEIKYVRVDGDDAWFAGECTYHSTNPNRVGDWNYIKVHDGGTPRSNGDTVWGEWFETEADLIAAVGEFNSDDPPSRNPDPTRGP